MSNVKKCVFIFLRKIVTDFASRNSRGNLFQEGSAVQQPQTMNGRNFSKEIKSNIQIQNCIY